MWLDFMTVRGWCACVTCRTRGRFLNHHENINAVSVLSSSLPYFSFSPLSCVCLSICLIDLSVSSSFPYFSFSPPSCVCLIDLSLYLSLSFSLSLSLSLCLSVQVRCRSSAVRRRIRGSTSAWRLTLRACATRPLLTYTWEVWNTVGTP